ncbi:hypothetical protein HU200_033468 [Digitaria exilis]|uniref:TF-B3 domain-containing protein n=1 Tax=Digitaria exilis TaxID=1010633 RepID=A0A835EMZ2_9POAL|nr:hypothetical protein HU200_033468 [Digitaria exilis]
MFLSSPAAATPTYAYDAVASPLLPSKRFKPVPPQPNGLLRWGAHIYEPRARPASQPSTWAPEHLFHKVLTPSDVGNLNRLVVPKHHAEKHFLAKSSNPLMATGMGVHLDFMDGDGRRKTWRFRYSYCTSSRIYIFTKGWRRYVREKGLQAGDTVAFFRSGFGPFKKMSIEYRRKSTTETKKKKQDDDDAGAGVMAVGDSRVVMLFGADIAR